MHSNVTDSLMGIYTSRLNEAILTAATVRDQKEVYKISFIAYSISFSFSIKQYII